jgi:heptosyltransferase-2
MRFLIVRLAAMGDLVFASSVLTRIRREYPNAHVTWAVVRPLAELVRLFDVDAVIEIDPAVLTGGTLAKTRAVLRAWGHLIAAGKFDRVVVVHEDHRYRILCAPVRSGSFRMLTPGRPKHSNPISGRFAGDEYARLLDPDTWTRGPKTERYDIPDLRSKIPVPVGASDRPYVVLVPAGGKNALRASPLRRWPVENQAELARRFRAEGLSVALVGDHNDTWVRPHFEGIEVDDHIATLSITGTMSVMRGATLVVSHDTGPMHLARLVRAPLVALFGPQLPWKHIPADSDVTVLWGGAGLPCRPCYDPHEPALCTNNLCMQDLTVDYVFGAAMRRLHESPVEAGRT